MLFDVFVYFDGNAKEALDFYGRIFNSTPSTIMTFKDSPPMEGITLSEEDLDKILYADFKIGNNTVMISDTYPGQEFNRGNNITLTVGLDNEKELERVFNELSQGGEVTMELKKTFFSEKYGEITDKFGIYWSVLLWSESQ